MATHIEGPVDQVASTRSTHANNSTPSHQACYRTAEPVLLSHCRAGFAIALQSRSWTSEKEPGVFQLFVHRAKSPPCYAPACATRLVLILASLQSVGIWLSR